MLGRGSRIVSRHFSRVFWKILNHFPNITMSMKLLIKFCVFFCPLKAFENPGEKCSNRFNIILSCFYSHLIASMFLLQIIKGKSQKPLVIEYVEEYYPIFQTVLRQSRFLTSHISCSKRLFIWQVGIYWNLIFWSWNVALHMNILKSWRQIG